MVQEMVGGSRRYKNGRKWKSVECVVCLFVPHREDGEEGSYKWRAVSSVLTYLPGRGLSVISKADGLGPAPPLHCRRGCLP